MLNRRQFFSLAPSGLLVPALGSTVILPRPARALPSTSERKFLFLFCDGGWDTTMVFTPEFDNSAVDMESDAILSELSGIPFVDSESRSSVRNFFESYGDQTCIVNGMEVRSVTHERCQRMCFTGGSDAEADDWGVLIGSLGQATYPVPHLVMDGPAFTGKYTANVVRSGEVGQVVDLMDGSALTYSTQPVKLARPGAEALEEAFVKERIAGWTGKAGRGAQSRLGGFYGDSLVNLDALIAASDSVDLDPEQSGCARDLAKDMACVWNAFEAGLSRCAMVRSRGWCSVGWDTHSNNSIQSTHFKELFDFLTAGLDDLQGRTSLSGGSLADEVTVVVFSEMGRHPQLTGTGRGHWTYTSFMLVGSGVRGGQVIGQMDENFTGLPVDLTTGEVTDSGALLLPSHFGATLLALADIDPAEHIINGEPIMAAVDI